MYIDNGRCACACVCVWGGDAWLRTRGWGHTRSYFWYKFTIRWSKYKKLSFKMMSGVFQCKEKRSDIVINTIEVEVKNQRQSRFRVFPEFYETPRGTLWLVIATYKIPQQKAVIYSSCKCAENLDVWVRIPVIPAFGGCFLHGSLRGHLIPGMSTPKTR